MANNKTTYQNLNSIFNLDGTASQGNGKGNKKIIIRGKTPEEIQRKNLEVQQQDALRNKFFNTTDHGFQKAMQYESARISAYIDYEGFEYYPIVASALDLLMEESTTIGENGKMLNIYSNNDRISKNLEELFYDILNINTNLPFWTRNLVKYGNNFVHILGEKKKGIVASKQLVNYEMERHEKIVNGKSEVRFQQRETSDMYNQFEMVHFRLLTDDKYIPYGTSVLSKVRRVVRQLILAEDAMLTYRIVRAGEKKIFKIDVGNIDEDDVENYLDKVSSRFKKQQQVYPNDGQIDYRFNILGNDEDYFIPVRNSNVQTGIDTLPGASNLSDIADISYLRDNLFTGIGIPKPFLGFQDSAGDGKNMAQMDIRFAKKINRIQQALVQELNKMAIIHLHLKGFSKDDLSNFTLSLTNPSTQEELLKTELLREKSQVYGDLTRVEGGIAAMSHTEAKRRLFNMSDKDIVDDFKKQRMERTLAQELTDSPIVIKKTGLFDDVDAVYGDGSVPPSQSGEEDEGGDLEQGEGDFEGNEPPIGGDSDDAPQSPADLPPVEGESVKKKRVMSEEEYNKNLDRLINIGKEKKMPTEKLNLTEISDRNTSLNKKADSLGSELEDLLKESKRFNTKEGELNMRNFHTNKIDEEFDLMKINIEEAEKKKKNKKDDK